ncbi:MAG: hypothetical protein AAFV07_21530, partial [Bacteroidota bacterium]
VSVNMGGATLQLLDTLVAVNDLDVVMGRLDNNPVQVGGNVDFTGYNGGGSDLIFAGDSPQTFNPGGSPGQFNNDIKIIQERFSSVQLLGPLLIDNNNQELTLTKGALITSDINLLTLADNRVINGGGDSSFVEGPMLKIGNDEFTFPIGADSAYAPLTISAPGNSADAFQAQYHSSGPPADYDRSSLEVTISEVSACEYWELERTSGTSEVSVSLTWAENRSCEILDINDVWLAGWDDDDQWKSLGSSDLSGDTYAGAITNSLPISAYNAFTLARNSNVVLPVELANLALSLEGQHVAIA